VIERAGWASSRIPVPRGTCRNCAVEYPFNLSVSASGAQVLGRRELYPGAEVAISVMPPMADGVVVATG